MLAWWLTKAREYLGTGDADVRTLLGKRPRRDRRFAGVERKLNQATLHAELKGGAGAINAYHDPLMDFARVLDAPARAVRADYENNVTAVTTKNSALIAKARFALEGKGAYPDATFTLRLSYGAVAGYQENGHAVAPATTFAGTYAHATCRDPFKLQPFNCCGVDPTARVLHYSPTTSSAAIPGSPVIGHPVARSSA